MTSHERRASIESLREQALGHVRREEYDRALRTYDEALAIADDVESRELLTINKADAMLAAGMQGPEIQELPKIILRRRSPLHTFLAAYALMFRCRLQNDIRRALSYGQTAIEAARETGNPLHIAGALNEMGNIYELDSQFEAAVAAFEEALTFLECIENPAERRLATVAIVENLGYSRIQVGDAVIGTDMILSVIDEMPPSARADAHLDASLGCLRIGDYDRARRHGTVALGEAADPREIRNAHYLLGEVACRLGDEEQAGYHFDRLLAGYPSCGNLKNLLFAVDLLPLLNLRL